MEYGEDDEEEDRALGLEFFQEFFECHYADSILYLSRFHRLVYLF